jgi:S-adenosylmethionine decarboxylase
MAYGYQLLLDLYGCKREDCDDLELCYRFLDEIVTYLGVKKQSPPSIFRTEASSARKHAGLSGWVPLIESSVVIHTLVPDAFVSIDVYSCKSFDCEGAISFTKEFFNPEKLDSHWVVRGNNLWADQSPATEA